MGGNDSPQVKSASLALGVFLGIIPIWGFQTAAAFFFATIFRLNKLLTFAGSNISIPPMIPLIILGSLQIGAFVMNKNIETDTFDVLNTFKNNLVEYVVGSIILASISAFVIGIVIYFLLLMTKRK